MGNSTEIEVEQSVRSGLACGNILTQTMHKRREKSLVVVSNHIVNVVENESLNVASHICQVFSLKKAM